MSLGANVVITALTARISKQKTYAEQKRRELLKRQENQLNQLASNLPIWRLYGWGDMFVSTCTVLSSEVIRL